MKKNKTFVVCFSFILSILILVGLNSQAWATTYTNTYSVTLRVAEDAASDSFHFSHERIADYVSNRNMNVPNYLAVFKDSNGNELARVCSNDAGYASVSKTSTSRPASAYAVMWFYDCNDSSAATDSSLRRWTVVDDINGPAGDTSLLSSTINGTYTSLGKDFSFGTLYPSATAYRMATTMQVYTDHFRDVMINSVNTSLRTRWGRSCSPNWSWNDCTGRVKIHSYDGDGGYFYVDTSLTTHYKLHVSIGRNTHGWNFPALFHELGHSTQATLWEGYLTSNYHYPSTTTGNDGHGASSEEWGDAALCEGWATFMGAVSQFYKLDCDNADPWSASDPISLGWNVEHKTAALVADQKKCHSASAHYADPDDDYYRFRSEVNVLRYLWDLYDSNEDHSNFNTWQNSGSERYDQKEYSYWRIIYTMNSFCSTGGNNCYNETDGVANVDQPNPRDVWQILYDDGYDSISVYYMNCMRDATQYGYMSKGWQQSNVSPMVTSSHHT